MFALRVRNYKAHLDPETGEELPHLERNIATSDEEFKEENAYRIFYGVTSVALAGVTALAANEVIGSNEAQDIIVYAKAAGTLALGGASAGLAALFVKQSSIVRRLDARIGALEAEQVLRTDPNRDSAPHPGSSGNW